MDNETLPSLITQIQIEFPQRQFSVNNIHNILFVLKTTFPNKSDILDSLVFDWSKDGVESIQVGQALKTMQSERRIIIDKHITFIDRSLGEYFWRKGVTGYHDPMFDYLSRFSLADDPCKLLDDVYKTAPYSFMHSFRADFLPKLHTFQKLVGQQTGRFLEDRCYLSGTEEIKQAIYASEMEFPAEPSLPELDDIFLQYVTNLIWVVDYSKYPKSGPELERYYTLLKRTFQLGYQIWTAFLIGYEMQNDALVSEKTAKLGSQYQQCIAKLSEACDSLETDVLSVVRKHLPTELTEKQRKTLELFNKY